jgi:hypothetical protein
VVGPPLSPSPGVTQSDIRRRGGGDGSCERKCIYRTEPAVSSYAIEAVKAALPRIIAAEMCKPLMSLTRRVWSLLTGSWGGAWASGECTEWRTDQPPIGAGRHRLASDTNGFLSGRRMDQEGQFSSPPKVLAGFWRSRLRFLMGTASGSGPGGSFTSLPHASFSCAWVRSLALLRSARTRLALWH